MASESTAIQGRESERASLSVAGQRLTVLSLRGEEAVSQLFRFDLVCAAEAGGALPEALLAAEATLTLLDPIGAQRTVRGIVAEAAVRLSDEGAVQLSLSLRPRAYLLSLERSSRVFHERSAVEIVEETLGRCGQASRLELTSAYEKRAYRVQRREDDLSFVLRLLEEEGIHFRFDNAGTTMVLSDDSTRAPEIEGGAAIEYAVQTGLSAERERVEEIGLALAATPTAFTLGSFDWQRPNLPVLGRAGNGAFEVYDAPGGGPKTPAACERRARTLREAAAAREIGVLGRASSIRLVPGMVMRVVDHPLPLADDHFLVTRVTLEMSQRGHAAGEEDRPASCRFEAIAVKTPFRPSPELAPGQQAGLEEAVVVGRRGAETYPDPAGCVRVRLRWDESAAEHERAGTWMRVAQRATEASMLLPRVGSSVLVWHEEGNVDAPSVLARLHDTEHPPSYLLPEHKTRVVWRTATTPGDGSHNEIHFEDQRGREELFMNASRDMVLLTRHVKDHVVGRDARREIGNDQRLTVGASLTQTVSGDQAIEVGGGESLSVGAGRAKTVSGAEAVAIAGARATAAGDKIAIGVTADRRLGVAAALCEQAAGPVVAVAGRDLTKVVGGAEMKMSGGSISTGVGATQSRYVAGPRLEIAGRDIPASAGVRHDEVVGGSMVLRSGKAFIDGATATFSLSVAGVLESAAPDIAVEAAGSIVLRCGASAIILRPKGIEIRSPAFDLSGAKLTVKTLVVEHN